MIIAEIYGYVRVSTRDQNEDQQLIALRELQVPKKIFLSTNNPARILTVRSTKSCCEK